MRRLAPASLVNFSKRPTAQTGAPIVDSRLNVMAVRVRTSVMAIAWLFVMRDEWTKLIARALASQAARTVDAFRAPGSEAVKTTRPEIGRTVLADVKRSFGIQNDVWQRGPTRWVSVRTCSANWLWLGRWREWETHEPYGRGGISRPEVQCGLSDGRVVRRVVGAADKYL